MNIPSSQRRTPFCAWPAARQEMLARELAEGRDTIAGLAHHHGLPVETVLECWERCLNRGRQAGPECPLVEGPQPALSRFAGMC